MINMITPAVRLRARIEAAQATSAITA